MSTQSTLMTMPKEVLLMIFLHVYKATKIHFKKGLQRSHEASNTESWMPEELILPMLICKDLRLIAWEAFQKNTLFIFPGWGMDQIRRYTWWDKKLVKDPTDLARRVQSDVYFADLFASRLDAWKNLLPNLKELSITGAVAINNSISIGGAWEANILYNTDLLQEECLTQGIKLNMYLVFPSHRMPGTRQYMQSVRVVMREDGSVAVKEVRAATQSFYDEVKQFIKDKFAEELEEMRCTGRRKLIRYVDSELDWQENP